MIADSEPDALLAEYLEAAKEERQAWQALSSCEQSMADCKDQFLRWRRANEAAQEIAVRWQDAIGMRKLTSTE